MPTVIDYILIIFSLIISILLIYIIVTNRKQVTDNNFDDMFNANFDKINNSLEARFSNLRTELDSKMTNILTTLSQSLSALLDGQSQKQIEKLDILIKTFNEQLESFQKAVNYGTTQTETKLKDIRDTVQKTLTSLKDDNSKQLEKMRETVDEKLQKTLNERLTQSFNLVTENLNQVSKGLGEMKVLAKGVGDLKNVLTNVKTRGIVGENQLGNILEQILTKDQYDKNVITKKGSRDPVEFAIKLPGLQKGEHIYLPIDAKFPLNSYHALIEAHDSSNKEEFDKKRKELTNRIKSFAKDIADKYIDVPNTTNFGIMFLPIEGLYAEVVNSGVTSEIQRDYHINIAGPSTMAALLNSISTGFRTLALQEKSGKISKYLGAVRTEFQKFGAVLANTQAKLDAASKDLESLVGTRTRQINRQLKNIEIEPKTDNNLITDSDEIKV